MEKDENFSAALPGSFLGVDYTGTSLDLDHDDHHQHQQFMPMKQQRIGEGSSENGNQMVDYMLNNNPTSQHHLANSGFCGSTSLDKLSFADVMQFADLGPKLALNQTSKACEEEQETGIDPVYFLKFPVLNERLVLEDDHESHLLAPHDHDGDGNKRGLDGGGEEEARVAESTSVQLQFIGHDGLHKSPPGGINEGKNKRKRPRTMKTSEEVESQRMTHIAVERNRRKQMNEHLRVLRSLMPGSYVQRGDQASIIGGAIEFVRELEQLLQCLESQKRRRLYGDGPPRPIGDSSSLPPNNMQQQPQVGPPFFTPDQEQIKMMEFETGLREETAESKSSLADVEVRVLGFDAMIKILCRRRPGQLIKTIAALEDLQLNILHTNITTIEQTVLYSFNVKVASEGRFAAEDIANSVQQILSFIQANGSM